MSLRFLTIIFLFFSELALANNSKSNFDDLAPAAWKPLEFSIAKNSFKTVNLSSFVYPFSGSKNSITKLAPELAALKSIKFPLSKNASLGKIHLQVMIKQNARLLLGIFRDSVKANAATALNTIRFSKGHLSSQPVLKNAISISGMPAVDIYAVEASKGVQTIDYEGGEPWLLVGVIDAKQNVQTRDVQLPDGRLWDPFIIERFYSDKSLFEIIDGPDAPVVDEGMAGTESIQGGFEGGAVVKVGDTYHMFPTERAGEPGVPAYYDRVKTRIGHWTSKDAKNWKREATIYQASGTYAVTDDDNPLNDRRAAIWSYMPVFNKAKNRWYGYYLTYTVHKEIEPNHSFGRIWQTESQTAGWEGIAGPYSDGKLIMEPWLNSQLWEGRQGVASFFP